MNFTPNQQYNNAAAALKLVRDSVDGEPTVKQARYTYLKNPDSIDQKSDQSINRYAKYIDGAEFDGFPQSTEIEVIGRMKAAEAEIDLPSQIDYLENNADGDGLSMTAMIEVLYRNLLEAKYHIMLSEMDSLASVDTESLSVADLAAINPQATIKLYTRESMIDWDYTRINGQLQISLMVLREITTVRDEDLNAAQVTTYLVLALDENGDYYQQKYIEGDSKSYAADGDRVYPEVGKERIKFIPVSIVADVEFQAGQVPKGQGYLYPISSAAISRYQVSADYKESLRFMQPTTFTRGWKNGDKELFKTLNGREYVAFGVGMCNNLPNNVEVDIKGLGIQSEPYERYMSDNESKAVALGASFNTNQTTTNTSATEASIADANQTAAMSSIVNSVEQALVQCSAWCLMFMGGVSPDQVSESFDQISIDLYDDFGVIKMTPEEVRVTIEAYVSSLISKDEAIKKLSQGGFTVSDAENVINELELDGADPVITPSNQSQDNILQSNGDA